MRRGWARLAVLQHTTYGVERAKDDDSIAGSRSREGGIERDFARLRDEFVAALERAARGQGDPPRKPRGRGPKQGAGRR